MQRSFIAICVILFLSLISGASAAFGKRARARFGTPTISGIADFTVVLRPYPTGFPTTNTGVSNDTPMLVNITIRGLTPGTNYNYLISPAPIAQDDSTCDSTRGFLIPDASRPTAKDRSRGYKCDPNDVTGTCGYGDLSGIYGQASVSRRGETYIKQFVLNYLKLDSSDNSSFDIYGNAFAIRSTDGRQSACGNIFLLNKCPS